MVYTHSNHQARTVFWQTLSVLFFLYRLSPMRRRTRNLSFNVRPARHRQCFSIHADVYKQSEGTRITILAVHGFTEVGSTVAAAPSAIFADGILGQPSSASSRFDMPVHGGSGVPSLRAR